MADYLLRVSARFGIGLRVEGGELVVYWDDRHDEELRRRLVGAKAEIVAALAHEPSGPEDPRWMHDLLCDRRVQRRWREIVDALRGGRLREPPTDAVGFAAWRQLREATR